MMKTNQQTELKAQPMAEGIRINKKFSDATYFTVSCDCGNADHDIEIFIENEDGFHTVNFSVLAKTKWWKKTWDGDRWYHCLWNGLCARLSLTFSIWFKGYAEMHIDAMLSKQTALNMANAIQTEVTRISEKK
jgi:hypothetical protein